MRSSGVEDAGGGGCARVEARCCFVVSASTLCLFIMMWWDDEKMQGDARRSFINRRLPLWTQNFVWRCAVMVQ